MKSSDTILTAILVVLVVIVAYQGFGWMKSGPAAKTGTGSDDDSSDGFHAGSGAHAGSGGACGTVRTEYFTQPSPEHLAEAEREQWYAATEADHTGGFDTELGSDMQTDTMQYHSAAPAIDYSTFVTDLVVDPRTQENHRRWASEMKPWSGSVMRVDDLDEAMEASTHFIGLRRPQPIHQGSNPLQLTENDHSTFAKNPKFNFRG
jgi:hypothetical protein